MQLQFYIFTALTIKLSILCLYRRLFSTPAFRSLSFVAGLAVVALFIAACVASAFQCWPISHFWDPLGPGTCFNFNAYFLGASAAEAVVDTAILVLPLHSIWKLQLSRKIKSSLIGIFLLGGM